MRSAQGRTLDTLRRSQTFLTDNAAVLGTINESSERRALDEAVNGLIGHAADQETGRVVSRGQTAKQVQLRRSIRIDHMQPIATIAREKLHGVPELTALRMPAKHATTSQLVAHAAAMATAAVAHARVFTDAGLPVDFADQLRAAADAVRATVDIRAKSRGQAKGATGGLSSAEKRGRAALRIINALVVSRLQHDQRLLAEWRGVRRIHASGSGGGIGVNPHAASAPAVTPEVR